MDMLNWHIDSAIFSIYNCFLIESIARAVMLVVIYPFFSFKFALSLCIYVCFVVRGSSMRHMVCQYFGGGGGGGVGGHKNKNLIERES